MNSTIKKSFSASLFVLLALISFVFLSAFNPMSQAPEGSIVDRVLKIAQEFASLAGISAAVGVFVGFLRAFNVVKTDDQSGRATATLNLLAFAVLVYFGVFRPDLSLDFLDSTAAKIASVGLFILGLVLQMIIPAPVLRLAYQARVPVLGTVGERVEMRAHFVGAPEASRENWSLADLNRKTQKPE